MTNATVDTAVTSVDGQKLVVKYKDGEKTIIVSAENRNRHLCSGDHWPTSSPAQKIFIAAAKKLPDGTLAAPDVFMSADYAVWRGGSRSKTPWGRSTWQN